METPIEPAAPSQFKMVDDPSQLSMFQNQPTEPVIETPAPTTVTTPVTTEPVATTPPVQNTPSVNVEQEVVNFMSEKLGRKFTSFDELTSGFNSAPQYEVDDRVKAINDFVKTTGRSPEDWLAGERRKPRYAGELRVPETRVPGPATSALYGGRRTDAHRGLLRADVRVAVVEENAPRLLPRDLIGGYAVPVGSGSIRDAASAPSSGTAPTPKTTPPDAPRRRGRGRRAPRTPHGRSAADHARGCGGG